MTTTTTEADTQGQEYRTGRLDFVATALDALHHGAGTSGNTQMLRVQEITTPDGQDARVPFISGNSFKHAIRVAGVEHALATMGVADGTFSKAVVDLLFSGGHLSKAGAAVNLSRARRLAELFPVLSICGYSAGNHMEHSKLTVDNIHLVCRENAFRMPAELLEEPHAARPASSFRGEEFGTRHEATRNPKVSRLLTESSRLMLEGNVSDALDAAVKSGKKAPKAVESSQMIYEFQVIKPGARFFGGITYRSLTRLEVAALRAALSTACEGKHQDGLVFHLGAKSSIGYGRVAMRWTGSLRHIVAPSFSSDASLVPASQVEDELDEYTEHLRAHRDEIVSALEEAMA